MISMDWLTKLVHGMKTAPLFDFDVYEEVVNNILKLKSFTVEDLCVEAYTMAVSKGWYDDEVFNFPEKLSLIHAEVSEALEEFRNGRGFVEIYYSEGGKPEGIPIELADICIRIFDLCARLNIDLQAAITEKMKYNATRPHRHGGKVC